MEIKTKWIWIINITTVVFVVGFVMYSIGHGVGRVEGYMDRKSEENWTSMEEDIINESQYNFEVMRDLFTPMYNDSVTVENAGYIETIYDWSNNTIVEEGGWAFWVNHSRVLSSFYFENKCCYKILFPTWGRIRLMEC